MLRLSHNFSKAGHFLTGIGLPIRRGPFYERKIGPNRGTTLYPRQPASALTGLCYTILLRSLHRGLRIFVFQREFMQTISWYVECDSAILGYAVMDWEQRAASPTSSYGFEPDS